MGSVNITVNLHIGDNIHKTEVRIPEGMDREEIKKIEFTPEQLKAIQEDVKNKYRIFTSMVDANQRRQRRSEYEQSKFIATSTATSFTKHMLLKGEITPSGVSISEILDKKQEESPVKPVPSTDLPDKDKK